MKDYIAFNEYYFLWTSLKYVLFKRTTTKTRIYRSSLGTFLSRKGSLDFQFANYGYEWNVKSFILEHYSNYNIFLDVGANIGTYSFLLAAKGLSCFAFEPVRENYKTMQINISLNDMEDKIVPFQFGLGATNSNETFIFEPLNTGASHLAHQETKEECFRHHWKMVHSDIKSLDSVIDQIKIKAEDRVLVKIDTEGMELLVIEGAKKFLSRHPYLLIIMETKHSDIQKIKDFFSSIGGFEYLPIDEMNIAVKKIVMV